MTEIVNQSRQNANDEIDLRELFSAIWQGKWIIIVVTAIFTVAAVFYAIKLPNIYKSEALLSPAFEKSNFRIPGQLSGLAALAGVNIGGQGGDKTALALEILKSREFLSRFIAKYDLFIPLMAAKGWVRQSDQLIINEKIYDQQSQQWVRKVKPPFSAKPSLLEAHEALLKRLTVSQAKDSGMVTLAVQHYSPFLAKQWAELLIKEINDEMRSRELSEAQSSIAYLTAQIEKTNIADLRSMLFSLIEEQTKTVMLANVREEYVFKTVDPAVVAERKDKPARALIVVLATMLGGMFSVFFVLVRYFSNKN